MPANQTVHNNQESTFQNATFGQANRDLGSLVRKWNIRFSGNPPESIETFLSNLEDAKTLAKIADEDLLPCL